MATTDRLQGFDIGVAVKPACTVASTGNLTLSAAQTVDGVAVGNGERVLVKDQTDASENGIYIADSSTWLRSKDFDGSRDAIPGTLLWVDRGTANAGSLWVAESSSTATSISIGSSIAFTQINPALAGVSTFSNDTLFPLTTAGAWRAGLGINEPGESVVTATSTGTARSALSAQEDVITTQGDMVKGSTAGAAARLALGSKNYLLGSDGSDVVYVGGVSFRSSSFTIGTTDNNKLLSVSASSTDITISFPAVADSGDGLRVGIQRSDASTNTMTLIGSGAETINGSTALALTVQYQSVTICGSTLAWYKQSEVKFFSGALQSQVSSTSGTAIEFTGIKSDARRITIMLDGVSGSGTDNLQIQLGTASSYETSGYTGGVAEITTGSNVANFSAAFSVTRTRTAASVATGIITIVMMDPTTNRWAASGTTSEVTARTHTIGGAKSLAGVLTRLRINWTGSDTFDAGAINVVIE